MKTVIPENFNFDYHLEKFPPSHYGIERMNKDHALFVLSQIIIAPAQDQSMLDNIDIVENYTLLYSNRLQSVVHDYKRYLNYFIETNVIECDGLFIKSTDQPGKEKSYGYRFTLHYSTCNELQTLEYDRKFNNVLKKKQKKDFLKLKHEYGHLLKEFFPSCKLDIDFKSGIKLAKLERDYYVRNPNLLQKEYNKKKHSFVINDPLLQYRYTVSNILSVHTGDIHFSVDAKGKRFHSALTNMKKVNRNFLTYKGEYLTSFDIKNSQPYLITSLFNKKIYINNTKGVNIYNINKNISSCLPSTLGTSVNFFENFSNEDVTLYRSLVSGVDNNPSDLYLYMKDEYDKIGIKYPSRNAVKPIMYEVLFTANRFSTPVKRKFEELFPTVNNLFRQIKEKDKTALPCLLQSIESYLVLQVITKRMARNYPNAPLFTIHDSVATTNRYADNLQAIMFEELEEFTGLPPKIEKEYWHPDKVNWDQYKM